MVALTPIMDRYILHWGEMGTRWGVNRTVAQIHALLYLVGDPLPADEITETLGVARSNVSNSLKELQSLGIVHLVHVRGDRRDHFAAEQDLWTMLLTIVEARKRREIDPTLAMLRDCVAEAEDDTVTDPAVRDRIIRALEFVATLTNWYEQMRRLPKSTLVALMKMGTRVARFIPGKSGNSKDGETRAEMGV